MTWKTLCSVSELEEDELAIFEIDGVEFLVIRTDEAISVIPPMCPHMTASLAEGFFDDGVLTCSKHLWQWSIKDGSPMGIAEEPLQMYESKEEDGNLLINFEKEIRYSHECG